MKKLILILIAAAIFAGAFVACGGGAAKAKIGIAIYKYDDTFMSYVRRTIETAAATAKMDFLTVDSQGDQPTQNKQIDQFLTQGCTALAINPVDRTAASTIISTVKAKNIPIVFFNREPEATDMQSWDKVYYVGAKAQQSGEMEGSLVVDYFKANTGADKNKDGKIQYIMLQGEPGHQDALLRSEWSIKAIEAAGLKVDKLVEETAHWQRAEAQQKMAAFIAKWGDKIELVLANNDEMALGAIEALKAAGYFTGKKFMPVAGVDATPPALDALEQGTLIGTVLNDAVNQGQATYDLAEALASGKDVTKTKWTLTDGKYVWIDYQKVTKDNYQQFKQP